MRKSLGVLGLVVGLVLVVGSGQAFAQVPGIDVHIGARAGWFTPIGNVGEDTSGRETKLSEGFAFGASIELDIPLSPINVRANFDATMGRSIEVEGLEIPGTDVDMMMFTGDLVFRPLPRLVVAQPYLLVGAGIKKYSAEGAFGDDTDLTGHLGAGADLRLGAVSLLVEINDYISSLSPGEGDDSNLQNDIFIMVGFRIGLL